MVNTVTVVAAGSGQVLLDEYEYFNSTTINVLKDAANEVCAPANVYQLVVNARSESNTHQPRAQNRQFVPPDYATLVSVGVRSGDVMSAVVVPSEKNVWSALCSKLRPKLSKVPEPKWSSRNKMLRLPFAAYQGDYTSC